MNASFIIGDICYNDAHPCKHDVYINGVKGLLAGDAIYRYLSKKNITIPGHFIIYKPNIKN